MAVGIAECMAAICFAGLVIFVGVPQALADAAPIPQEAIGGPAPAIPTYRPSKSRVWGRTAVDPKRAAMKMTDAGQGQVAIVVKPLELGRFEPEAFADWEHTNN